MKRSPVLSAVVLLALGAAPFLAEAPALDPGGFWIRATAVEGSYLDVTMDIELPPPGEYTVHAVTVRSEPSGTALAGLVDDDAPIYILESIQAAFPRLLEIGSLGDFERRFTLDLPPAEDTGIRVDYVIEVGGVIGTWTLAEGTFSSLEAFQFSAEPLSIPELSLTAGLGPQEGILPRESARGDSDREEGGGGGIRICQWCGEQFCGCRTCTGIFTICCPECTFVCGSYPCE